MTYIQYNNLYKHWVYVAVILCNDVTGQRNVTSGDVDTEIFPGIQSLMSPSPSSSICRPITSSSTFFFCPFCSASLSGFSDWAYQG